MDDGQRIAAPIKPTAAPQPAPAPAPKTERSRAPIVLALAAAALAAGYGGFLLTRPPLVETAVAASGPALDIVYATGIVDYVRQARIAPVVSAPIVRVAVEEGQRVRKGDLLAQLEDGPARGQAEQLAAQASTARLAAARIERLYEKGIAAKAALDEVRGQRAAAEAAARSARSRLVDYALRAPFAGAVLRRDAEPGDLAAPARVLFVIADPASLRITAELDERDVARVAIGQRALVRADAFPGETFEARVSELTPQGDAATRVFRMRLSLAPDAKLRAGMTVEANVITAERQDAILVPASAVREEGVFVLDALRAERRDVTFGARGGDLVEVRKGLALGERVIVDPPESLKDGQRVRTGEALPPREE